MTTPLRQLLAERVAERRVKEAAEAANRPVGAFTFLDDEPLLHFSTIGRTTGERRTKFWGVYATAGDTLYLIEEVGTKAHWVRNVIANPKVEVWGRDHEVLWARARIVDDLAEDALARRLVGTREWGEPQVVESGLVIAFDYEG